LTFREKGYRLRPLPFFNPRKKGADRLNRWLTHLLALALRGLPTLLLVLLLTACQNVGTVNWTVTQTTDSPTASPAAAAAGVVTVATPPSAVDAVCGPGQTPYEYADNSGYYCGPSS
jgi:hypothetical protein